MGKWTEDLGKELALFLNRLGKESNAEPEEEKKEKKKPLTIREIGLPRLMILLTAGLILLILTFPDFFSAADTDSSKKNTKETIVLQEEEEKLENDIDAYIENAENRLKLLLRKVEGVGEVEVMITIKSSGESIPLKDTPYEKSSITSEEGTGKRTEQGEKTEEGTVMVENSDGTTQPYVVRETVPEIEGVAVIAEGGGNSEIKKEIVEAVQALFNIKAHKIKVMKMS